MEQNINKEEYRQPRRSLCLACGTPFRAESPFLRICPICKAGEEWQSGAADFSLHSPANENAQS